MIFSRDKASQKQVTEPEITGRDMASAVPGMYPSYVLLIV